MYRGNEAVRRRAVPPDKAPGGALSQLGNLGARAFERVRGPVGFVGELVDAMAHVARHARRPQRLGTLRSVSALVERAGTDGIPIVLLLDFLVGFVIAFQTMGQLERYGANIYV